jgi:hypothetical protein
VSNLLEEMVRGRRRRVEAFMGGQMPAGFAGSGRIKDSPKYKGSTKYKAHLYTHPSKEQAVKAVNDLMFELMKAQQGLTGYKEFRSFRTMIDKADRQWKKDRPGGQRWWKDRR